MIREPKMLPWLARQAGVPVPVARAMWEEVVRESGTAAHGKTTGDVESRQVQRLRKRLEAWLNPQRGGGWILPLPLYRTWVDCQTRIFRSAWLAWARVVRMAPPGQVTPFAR